MANCAIVPFENRSRDPLTHHNSEGYGRWIDGWTLLLVKARSGTQATNSHANYRYDAPLHAQGARVNLPYRRGKAESGNS